MSLIHDTNLRKHHKAKPEGGEINVDFVDFFWPVSLSCPCSQDLGVQVSPNPTLLLSRQGRGTASTATLNDDLPS